MFRVDGCWLTPGEQEEAIATAIRGGSITWDNTRKLPLKKGGTTDIYENLRLVRNDPWMMDYFSRLFANPLRRLNIDRFVEVPEAVSPLAGHISAITGIPMVTIREEEKAGRVVKGKVIGDLRPGDRVAVIDNVITDGASKIVPLSTIRERGAEVVAMVVLMDRQQGWKKKLAEAGFGNVPVWSGFTLHDARKHLVETGLMQRCDPDKEAKNPVIVALDGKTWEDYLPLLDQLRPTGCIVKVNDLLVARGSDWLLPNLSVYGRIMIDPKTHDVDSTMENVAKCLKCPPWAITVHASGSAKMIQAAKKMLAGTGTNVLAVTVLTSFDRDTCQAIYHRDPLEQVMELAKIANDGGADGFVCSALEVASVSKQYPGKIFVVPGTRSPGADVGGQKRVATPREARDSGATHLVMGSQATKAADPAAEIGRVMKDELGIAI